MPVACLAFFVLTSGFYNQVGGAKTLAIVAEMRNFVGAGDAVNFNGGQKFGLKNINSANYTLIKRQVPYHSATADNGKLVKVGLKA